MQSFLTEPTTCFVCTVTRFFVLFKRVFHNISLAKHLVIVYKLCEIGTLFQLIRHLLKQLKFNQSVIVSILLAFIV